MLDFRYFKLNPLGEIFKKFFIKIEKEEQENLTEVEIITILRLQ